MLLTLTECAPLTADVHRWTLAGPNGVTRPGQFVQIALPGLYLRRPISVCDWTENTLTLVFRQVGAGTAKMAALRPGEQVDVLSPLGNGFDPEACGCRPLLAGGGVGLPPLIGLGRALLKKGCQPILAAGFRHAADLFLVDEARSLGLETVVVTEDGSAGEKGLVTDVLDRLSFDSLCACGPLPMLKALHHRVRVPSQFSLEERMGCGFGACMGCSIQTKEGPKRVCADGPVFRGEALDW
ncbi:MAG: dihydroorotate dehydrogenase electron transfer subunit [Clostridia bacterium]|nr:dihydroorotate dehydrogenase electron transfer subunit [Clostridia bacterium]